MKLFFKIFAGLAVFILLAVFAVLQYISINTFKKEIQAFVSQEYDIRVQFDEDIAHSLYKPGNITFKRLSIYLEDKKILESKLRIDLKVMKVLNGDFGIDQLHFEKANLDMNQDDINKLIKRMTSNDKSNANNKKTKFSIHDFSIKNSRVKYQDYLLEDIELKAKMNQDQLTIKSLTSKVYQGELNLEGSVKYSKDNIVNLKGVLKDVPLQQWNENLKEYKYQVDGKAEIDFDLRWNKKLDANILIQSNSIEIKGMNLNRLLDGFIDSREVGILDIASYVTLGPIGAIVTNTLETGKSYPGLGRGETQIQKAYFKFKINDQIFETEDVALKTSKYRLAAFGKIDLDNKMYDNFKVHILNKKGCSRIFQELKGSLSSPEVGVTKTFAKGVIGPLTDLFSKVKSVVKKCEVIYEGEVSPP